MCKLHVVYNRRSGNVLCSFRYRPSPERLESHILWLDFGLGGHHSRGGGGDTCPDELVYKLCQLGRAWRASFWASLLAGVSPRALESARLEEAAAVGICELAVSGQGRLAATGSARDARWELPSSPPDTRNRGCILAHTHTQPPRLLPHTHTPPSPPLLPPFSPPSPPPSHTIPHQHQHTNTQTQPHDTAPHHTNRITPHHTTPHTHQRCRQRYRSDQGHHGRLGRV